MKRFAVLLLTLAMAFCCAAPAFAAGTIEVTEDVSVSDDYDWTRFQGQNLTLNVYNWGEYISNGSDDSVDVVAAFEKLTGIKVNYTTFDSNESMYAKLKSGAANYDVVIPSDYMVAKMIAEGMLAPLDYSNIPNSQNIDAVYRDPDYDPTNAYTVPYMLCTTGIIYNTTMVENAPTKWADLWDEQYAGNILMFNNSRDAYAIAAFKNGTSINPETPEEVDEVVETLKAQKPLVQAYVMDEIFDKMIGGEAAIGVIYSGEIMYIQDEVAAQNLPFSLEYVIPEEGTNVWLDSWVVPKNAKNKENAEKWINFLCRPDVAVKNFEYITYATPNKAAKEMLDEEIQNNKAVFPDAKQLKNCEVYRYLGDEADELYNSLWKEVKSD